MPLRSVPNPPDDEAVHPWEDTSSFHTKAREESNVVMSIRVPYSTARGIAKIVQSGKYPGLETNSDALRDAAWRWLRWMAEETGDPELAAELDVQRTNWKLEAIVNHHQQVAATIDMAESFLEGDHGSDAKRKTLAGLVELSTRIEASSPLRRRIIELLARHQ